MITAAGFWYNIRMTMKWKTFCLVSLASMSAMAASPVTTPGPGSRYATDAYPGFDKEENILAQSKKTPGFFSWWSGTKYDNPAAQLAWARECVANESWGRAARAYNALVAEWPASKEAPVAQEELADMYYGKTFDYEQSLEEYKYLANFYSSQCDYDAVAKKMYDAACAMRDAGKRIVFFRFANTTDVRRAFESVVVHAPGAAFAPKAMLTVAELREEDEEDEKAIEVYENLRSLYPKSKEASTALVSEAAARMRLLREHEYNRARCQDTISFMKMALLADATGESRAKFEAWRDEASALVEDEAYASAKFYDSKTRTRHSAISAYERFLIEYPTSKRSDEVRERLAVLKNGK